MRVENLTENPSDLDPSNIPGTDAGVTRGVDRLLAIIAKMTSDEVYAVVVSTLRAVPTDLSRLRYGQDLRIFLGWAHVEDLDPRTITRDDLLEYQAYIKRYGTQSQMRLMSVLRLLYRELEAADLLIDQNPAQKLPKIRGEAVEQPVGYSEQEIDDLLSGIKEQADPSNVDFVQRYLATRDYAIVHLALSTGLRASEIVGLTCADIEQAPSGAGEIRVRGRRERTVSVPSAVLENITKYRTAMRQLGLDLAGDTPLFIRIGPKADPQYAEAMTTRNLGKLVTKWTTHAALGGKNKAVHQLRRTAAMAGVVVAPPA